LAKLQKDHLLKSIDRMIHSLCEAPAFAAGLACGLAVLLVLFETINRYGQLSNLTIAEEYTGYILVLVSAFAAGSSFTNGMFPRLTVLEAKFPKRVREILIYIGLFTGLIVNGMYFWLSWGLFWESVRIGSTSWTNLYTPLAIPQGFLVVGFGFFEIVLLGLIVKRILESSMKRGQMAGHPSVSGPGK
jgi:TRAP-type C4-dicarboxylate transport system permease small subunit